MHEAEYGLGMPDRIDGLIWAWSLLVVEQARCRIPTWFLNLSAITQQPVTSVQHCS